MKALIEYIRSCFCKHDWELIFDIDVMSMSMPVNKIKTYRCKKCGLVKRYTAQ